MTIKSTVLSTKSISKPIKSSIQQWLNAVRYLKYLSNEHNYNHHKMGPDNWNQMAPTINNPDHTVRCPTNRT